MPTTKSLIRCAKGFISGSAWFFKVIGNAAYRFYWDDCFSRAASLSYTTLFALVPATYIMINMLHIFGVAQEQVVSTIEKILSGMLPPTNSAALHDLREQLFYYLEKFRSNVQELKTLSILLVAFTSISLINTIESAFNVVWRVTSEKSIAGKIAIFWTVLTLGSLLLYLSFYSSSQVSAIVEMRGFATAPYISTLNLIAPVLVVCLGLTVMFYNLPSAPVRLGDALLGGFVGAVLFEAVKWGFAFFMGNATTYSTIYGVLAAIPLFMFWMYLAWCVILFGAEVAYQSGSIHIFLGLRKYATELGEVGVLLGMRVLECIGWYFMRGDQPPSESEVAIQTGTHPVLLRNCLDALTEANLLTPPDPKAHRRTLVVSPSRLKLGVIMSTFQSREYRARLKKESGKLSSDECFAESQIPLLEIIRRAALHQGPESQMAEWTLADLIKFSPEMEK